MSRGRWAIAAGALALTGLAALLWSQQMPQQEVPAARARRALARLDPRSAHDALRDRCRADGGVVPPLTRRACAALLDVDGLSRDPQAAATRLHELSRQEVAVPGDAELLAEVQVLRTELLLAAGHSRQAARESRLWAEKRREPGVGVVRLWVAASEAGQAIGDEEGAQRSAERALELASKLR